MKKFTVSATVTVSAWFRSWFFRLEALEPRISGGERHFGIIFDRL